MLERAKDLGGGEDDFTEQNFLQNYFYLLCSAASSSSFSHSSSTSFLTDLSLSLSRTTIPSSSTSFLSLPLYDPESKKVNKTTERQWEGMEEKEKTKIEKEERKVIAEKKEGRTEVEGGGEEGRVVYSSSCAFLPDKWNHAQSFIFLGEGGGKEKGEEKEKEKEGDKEGEGEEMGGEGEVEEVEGKGDGPPFLVHFSGLWCASCWLLCCFYLLTNLPILPLPQVDFQNLGFGEIIFLENILKLGEELIIKFLKR